MTAFYLIRHAERTGDPQLLAGRMPGFSLTPHGSAHRRREPPAARQHLSGAR